MSWWLATVLFGSVLFPLGYWVNWSGRAQFGRLGAVTLAVPVVGLAYFDVVMLLSFRSPLAGPLEPGVTALGLVELLVVTGLLLPRVGRTGAAVVLIPSVLGLLSCVVLVGRGPPFVDRWLTVLGLVALLVVTGLSVLRVIGASIGECTANVTSSIDRRARLSLLLVALLVPAALVMHVPSTLDGTFCDGFGEYDVEDVRLSYDRSTMLGSYGVYVHGRQVYYLDLLPASGSPVYRVGTASTETIRRLMSVIERNGILCLNDRYAGIVLLSEPTSENLHVSTGAESKTIEVTPGTADAPPQVERTMDTLWDTGGVQPRVNASRFCTRLPADADTRLVEHCRYLQNTDVTNTTP